MTDEVDRGGMAYVLRGVDERLRRELALKVTPAPRDELPRDQLARFIEEAQITAQLEHPNIVPIHQLGVAPDGRVFFSMKLVRGRSLENILEARRAGDEEVLAEFGLRRLLDIFLQVCQAIQYAHARGVVHRDLKPGNIMVGDFGEALVMDWGIAKVLGSPEHTPTDALTTTGEHARPPLSSSENISSVRVGKEHLATQLGMVIGTPGYLSPEQAMGKVVDERTDLFSLGVILYEILAGQLPFDGDDIQEVLNNLLEQPVVPPSSINPSTPRALEVLTLVLLEKDPAKRTLSIEEVRAHIQNYIEGIERDYGQEGIRSGVLWVASALLLFAFLVWYVTGQAITALFVMAPATVFNAVGWFLLVIAFSYPLWGNLLAVHRARTDRQRFQRATDSELFVSGFLQQRTFAASLAPLSQLGFVIEVVSLAVAPLTIGQLISSDLVAQVVDELRQQWARALIVVLVFLFAYLFFLYREVRYARRIDRYETLVDRSGWETFWPVCLIVVLLLTIGFTEIADWVIVTGVRFVPYVKHAVLTQPIDVFDMLKTFVLQGTFLMGLVVGAVLVAFPAAEVLAASRLPYLQSDRAAVKGRGQYYLRSLAVFRVARVNWLYGGAMIGALTALAVLSEDTRAGLIEQVFYVLSPSLIGFLGYLATKRQVQRLLKTSPAIEEMVAAQVEQARIERRRARLKQLRTTPWSRRLFPIFVPAVCIIGFLLFTESGLHQRALQRLVVPISTEGWLLILPYALLMPLVLAGDWLQIWLLKRRIDAEKKDPVPPEEAADEAG